MERCSRPLMSVEKKLRGLLALPANMRRRVYVTVWRPSVRLSVPPINSSNNGRWVCCWAPCAREISIDSRGRCATGARAQQQMRVASCWEPTEEAQHRLDYRANGYFFRQGGRVPIPPFPHFFGLKFVHKLVHCCNGYATWPKRTAYVQLWLCVDVSSGFTSYRLQPHTVWTINIKTLIIILVVTGMKSK